MTGADLFVAGTPNGGGAEGDAFPAGSGRFGIDADPQPVAAMSVKRNTSARAIS
ncbi:MAG: hypothetical protein AAF715_13640 [Myxococcota bacterium]